MASRLSEDRSKGKRPKMAQKKEPSNSYANAAKEMRERLKTLTYDDLFAGAALASLVYFDDEDPEEPSSTPEASADEE